MPEFSNQDLDNLFQRGSERFDFEFNPEAWRRMETLLERRRRRALLWWWLLGLGASALILWAGYCYITNKDTLQAREKAEQEIKKDSTGEAGQSEGYAPRQKAGKVTGRNPGHGEAGRDLKQEPRPEAGTLSGETENIRQVEKPAARPLILKKNRQQANPKAKGSAPQAMNTIQDSAQAANQAVLKSEPAVEKTKLAEAALLPFRPITPESAGKIPALDQKQSLHSLPLRRDMGNSGFLLSLNAAPQISSVGPGDPGPVSLRAGLGLEYRFGRKWSLGAGVYRVKKRYTAGEGEYIPPKGFWVRQIAPDYSVGWCDVLELPFYGGYYLSGHQSDGLFLEAGITSLYMREEWYYYHYKQNAPDLIHYWEGRNENHAWLSLLHISPGYQLVPGKLWRLQVAPYIQIPLGGVGHGHLRLYSLGLNARVGIFKANLH